MPNNLFELISSASLGSQNSSLDAIGSVYDGRSLGQASQHVFVNAATGNLHVQDYLRPFQFLGFQVKLGFTYNSVDNLWRPSLGKSLTQNQQTVSLTAEDGSQINFQFNQEANSYIATGLANGNQILTQDPATQLWTLQHLDSGLIERFNSTGLLQNQIDAAGRQLTYVYANGKLQTVTDNAQRQVSFIWTQNSCVI